MSSVPTALARAQPKAMSACSRRLGLRRVSMPSGARQLGQKNSGRLDYYALRLQFVGERSEKRIVFLVAQFAQKSNCSPVGPNLSVHAGLVDSPGHCGLGYSALPESLDEAVKLPELEHVELIDVLGEGWIGFAVKAHGEDPDRGLARRVGKKERKLPAAGDKAHVSYPVIRTICIYRRHQRAIPLLEPVTNSINLSTSGRGSTSRRTFSIASWTVRRERKKIL